MATSATTEVPAPQGAGFPPFKTETFPSQLFWLVVTFAVLFTVLWRVAGPRIAGVIGARKGRIDGDLSAAQKHRDDADAALAGYEQALAAARTKAHALANEAHKQMAAEVERAKSLAEDEAKAATTRAEAQIAASRAEAAIHVTKAAQDAAAAIVAHLTGDNVSAEEAASAVRDAGGR
jgi:F-type H+-transporting ATPase subunit b